MQYGSILTLARAGATTRAWDSFVTEGLANVTDDPAALTLKGRLLKDQARGSNGDVAARLYLQSARAYADAAALRPDSYPLINAATMSLFAGQPEHAELLALQVLTMLDTAAGTGETPYWHEATRAEALLLLGRQMDAQTALGNAIVAAPAAWEDRAATLRQFRKIAEYRNESSAWLAAHAPPVSLYFKGTIGIAADDRPAAYIAAESVRTMNAGFGFGALAAGADILIAEALIEQGAELHLVLPIMASAFRAQSVAPFGEAWLPRFDRLFELAASVTTVAAGERLTDAAVDFAVRVAKGAALENAGKLEGQALGVELNDSVSPQFATATDNFVRIERSASLPAATLQCGDVLIMLAADAVADPANWNMVAENLYLRSAGSFDEAGALVHEMRQSRPAARCAVGAVTGEITTDVADTHGAKMLRLAQCAAPGTAIADRHSARAMLCTTTPLRIEPLGELADIAGAIEIYAIGPTT